MFISDVPAEFIAGVRHGLLYRHCENFITDDEMKAVATFCEAQTDPSDCAEHIAHDRGIAERKAARKASGSKFYLVTADHK